MGSALGRNHISPYDFHISLKLPSHLLAARKRISTELVGKIIQEIGTDLSSVPQLFKTAFGSWLKPDLKTLWEQSFTVLAVLYECFISQLQ